MDVERDEAGAVHGHLPAEHARRLAVDILLAQPEELSDDVLETALYDLRDRLNQE